MEDAAGNPVRPDPRIAYDARLTIGSTRGMARYLRALLEGREQQVIGLCAPGELDPDLRLVAGGFGPYPLWEQISLPRLIRKHEIDIFLAPYNTAPLRLPESTRLILVVHDLIYLDDEIPRSPSLYQNLGRIYRRHVVPKAIERADLIITVSKFTAKQLTNMFPIEPSRIRIIPNTLPEPWFRTNSAATHDRGYLLMVSGEAPSKNLPRALEAFALCRKMGHPTLQLKIAGVDARFQSRFERMTEKLGIARHITLLPRIGDETMRELYRQAELFFMPSLAEGFGIPVLEAMATGLPVVSSYTGSLPEVAEDAPQYCDPTSVGDMAAVLHRTLSDINLRKQMALVGSAQARQFHPDVVRPMIDQLWEEILRPRREAPNEVLAA